MNNTNQNKALYESPTCQEIVVSTATVMCASNTGIDPIEEGKQYGF